MAIEIRFDDGSGDDEVFFLASSKAWGKFIAWVESFDCECSLAEFVATGVAENTRALARDLASDVMKIPPPDDIEPLVEILTALIGVGNENESAKILDGANDDE